MASQGYNELRIVNLHEREARLFPRDEFFDASGKSLLLSSTRELSAVDLRELADGIELRALGLIGYLPLTDKIVLNLRPKFPTHNLWHILAVADEAYERLLPVLRTYDSEAGAPPHQLLARSFCYYLREILASGIARMYYQEEITGHYKPKVHIGRTAARFWSRGDPVNVASDTFAFSSSLIINGLLKSACLSFGRLMPETGGWSDERALIMDALSTLQRCAAKRMSIGDEALAAGLPLGLQRAYFGALTVYAMYLGFNKVGFPYDPKGRDLPSFLFKLDDIFESFVRNTFRLRLRAQRVSVLDGNIPKNQVPLFVESRRFPAKPDIVFRVENNAVAVGEVKYKPRLDEGDRYQLIAHTLATGAPVGVWISPVLAGEPSGLTYIGSIAGAAFYHYTLDIGSTDLVATTQRMVMDVAKLFHH